MSNLYTRLWLLLVPQAVSPRRAPAVRAWFVLAIIALWLLAAILMAR